MHIEAEENNSNKTDLNLAKNAKNINAPKKICAHVVQHLLNDSGANKLSVAQASDHLADTINGDFMRFDGMLSDADGAMPWLGHCRLRGDAVTAPVLCASC